MRGGGLAYATTRQLVERNMIGWRQKVMIRAPGQREIVEARYEWSHHYVSFRVDDNETGRDNYTGQADVTFGERNNPFMLNSDGGYAVVSSDWVAVRNRDQWKKCCIFGKKSGLQLFANRQSNKLKKRRMVPVYIIRKIYNYLKYEKYQRTIAAINY
jgi:hypothetical protein